MAPRYNPKDEEQRRGYEAAAAGKASFRHDRWWIDTPNSAELCRPDVVRGIQAYYRNGHNDNAKDAADLAGILEAEYRDEREAERDLRAGLHW